MRFFAPDYTIAPPRRPLTQESQRQPDPKPRRINHLGVPLRPGGSMRHKYARTYTICFDPTKPLAERAVTAVKSEFISLIRSGAKPVEQVQSKCQRSGHPSTELKGLA